MRRTRFAIVLGSALLLAACGDEPEVPEDDDGRSASGEVLEGTISDDMLALDKVRSQAPLLQEEEGASPTGEGTPATEEENTAEMPATEEETAAAEPEPESFDEAFSEEN